MTVQKSVQRQSIDASVFASEELPPDYTGPHLKWPITREFALDLLDHFRDNPDVGFSFAQQVALVRLRGVVVVLTAFRATAVETAKCAFNQTARTCTVWKLRFSFLVNMLGNS